MAADPLFLVFRDPTSRRLRARLLEGPLSVGRSTPPPGISLAHPSVAAEHAEIALEPTGARVRPVDPGAAVFVNDCLVTTWTQVGPGDLLTFGKVDAAVQSPRTAGNPRSTPARARARRSAIFSAARRATTFPVLVAFTLCAFFLVLMLTKGRVSKATPVQGKETGTIPAAVRSVVSIIAEGRAAVSKGSGVIVSSRGHVLTNSHVVPRGMQPVVILPTGQRVKAVIQATDRSSDLTLLLLADWAEPCEPIHLASGSVLEPGQTVYAVGSPLSEQLSASVSRGVVSAPARWIGGHFFVQHDAAINPGNSGGPLLDERGRLVGLNTWKIVEASGISMQGLGFAIPVDTIQGFLKRNGVGDPAQ